MIWAKWCTPVIPAAQEAEIRRIKVQSQPGQIVRKINPSQKRTGGMAQGVGPEFKPQYRKKTNSHTYLKAPSMGGRPVVLSIMN
jgi:hypothetical protein